MEYDVFISYKSEDIKIAAGLHRHLTENGLSVFFSQISIGDIGDAEYSDMIDQALENSSNMIVIASKHEYLYSGWVHYEWTSFANNLKGGYKSGNLITILGQDVKMADVPLGLRHRQSFRSKSYEGNIIKFLKQGGTIPSPKSGKNRLKLLLQSCLILIAATSIIALAIKCNQLYYPTSSKSYFIDYGDPAMAASLPASVSCSFDYQWIAEAFKDAQSGNCDAQFEIGNICYESKNYKDAIYWFSLSAKQGNPRAANGLGRCYYNGYGVQCRPRKAYNWFRYSAKHDCIEGKNNFGKCLEEGFGTIRNRRRAIKYYRSSADLGYPAAQFNLGIHIFCGDGTKANITEGLNWLKKAARNGSASAQMMLGDIYIEGLEGVAVDTTEALNWYKKAIDNTDIEIQDKVELKLLNL